MKKSNLRCINAEGVTKLALSLFLLIYAMVVAIITKNFTLFFAMLASSLGDIAIMSNRGVFNNTIYYNWEYGIVLFALAHILYMTAMIRKYTPVCIFIAFCAFILIIFFVFHFEYKDYIWTNVAYAIIIVLNFVNTLFFNKIAIVGLVFFICSDIILIITEKKNPKWQYAIWITYVIAQACVITAVLHS